MECQQTVSQPASIAMITLLYINLHQYLAILPHRGGWKGSMCAYLKSMLYRLSIAKAVCDVLESRELLGLVG